MKNFKQIILNEDYDDTLKYTVELRDPDEQLLKLLEHIKDVGNIGHSFNIIVDPEDKEHSKEFYIDGDGAFMIKEIKSEVIKSNNKSNK